MLIKTSVDLARELSRDISFLRKTYKRLKSDDVFKQKQGIRMIDSLMAHMISRIETEKKKC